MKSFLRYLLIFFICLFASGPDATALRADSGPQRFGALVKDLTKQLIFSFSENGSEEKCASLLQELRRADPETGRIWEQILLYWNETEKDGFVNTVKLPDDTNKLPLPEDLPSGGSLCIIIPGYTPDPGGTMQDELLLRLFLGLECARQYPDSFILVTGGSAARDVKSAAEADCMAEWLEDNGIDSSRIIIENRSETDVERAVFSCEILRNEYPQIKNAVIVTGDCLVPLECLLFQAGFLLSGYQDNSGPLSVIANSGVYLTDERAGTPDSTPDALWALACSY